MSAITVLTSPNIALGRRIEFLANELETLFPKFSEMVEKLEEVEDKFCRPLLLLRPEELEKEFSKQLSSFIYHIISAIIPSSSELLLNADKDVGRIKIKKLIGFEKKLFEEIKHLLREKSSQYELNPEDVIKAHAAVINYDIWILNLVLNIGLDELIRRISERAEDEVQEFTRYLYSLFYTLMTIDLVILKNIPHRKDTLKLLVSWSVYYAEEVEDYLDTLNLAVINETYEIVKDFLEKQ
ncbi:MAG: hypothetical protein NDF54_07710 [archaeon GB-1867-035]|mgnify:CR=1 FL=1|nr:hypothetical protein [Candidatus Culexmicrobium profundum]